MLKKTLAALVVVVAVTALLPGDASAQQPPRRGSAQVFGGFSYLYRTLEGEEGVVPDSTSMYGVQGDITYYVNDHLGIAAELGYVRGSFDTPGIEEIDEAKITQVSFLFGPRYQLGTSEKFFPAVHVLAGWATGSLDEVAVPEEDRNVLLFLDESGFAVSFGATFDVAISPSVSYRIIQPDVMLTFIGDSTKASFRIGTGIVGVF